MKSLYTLDSKQEKSKLIKNKIDEFLKGGGEISVATTGLFAKECDDYNKTFSRRMMTQKEVFASSRIKGSRAFAKSKESRR